MTTATAILTEDDLLYPLNELCGHRPQWQARPVDAAAMPEPYRGLLVHERDMTSTLESHHAESIELAVLERRRQGDLLYREVVLVGAWSRRPVEFGAIRIDLAPFQPAARDQILAGKKPLGAILADHQVPYLSRPQLYFTLRSDALIDRALGLAGPATLYGRRNVLTGPAGRLLAEVVEILPPR